MTISPYWFTIAEAAEFTGIDEATIRSEVRQNHLHPRRQGMVVMIVDAELERWLRVRFPSHRPGAIRAGRQPDPTPGPESVRTPSDFSVEEWLNQTGGRDRNEVP